MSQWRQSRWKRNRWLISKRKLKNKESKFKFPHEVRRLIYTTNHVEALHRQFRKVTKSKAVFPTDDALLKMLFLAASNASKKWRFAVRDWLKVIAQLDISFEGRIIMN